MFHISLLVLSIVIFSVCFLFVFVLFLVLLPVLPVLLVLPTLPVLLPLIFFFFFLLLLLFFFVSLFACLFFLLLYLLSLFCVFLFLLHVLLSGGSTEVNPANDLRKLFQITNEEAKILYQAMTDILSRLKRAENTCAIPVQIHALDL